MKISVCGPNRQWAVNYLESVFGVKSINPIFPGSTNDNLMRMFDYASDTYKHNTPNKHIIDGGVFDAFSSYDDEGYSALQEQIMLNAISNVDKVIIVTDGFDKKIIDEIEYYASLYNHIHIVNTTEDISEVIK